jgi:hypothetical protein
MLMPFQIQVIGSAVCAIATVGLYVHGGLSVALDIPVTILAVLIIPYVWHKNVKKDYSLDKYAQSIIGFCAYTMLIVSMFNLAAGALLVGVRYLLPVALVNVICMDVALLVSYYWSKTKRLPVIVSPMSAALSTMLSILFLMAEHS